MKNTTRKNRTLKRAAALLLACAVAFTGLPLVGGGLDAHAATKSDRLPRVSNLRKSAATQTSITLKWKKLTVKQRKKVSGIAIYRKVGSKYKRVKRLSDKSTAYKDKNLKPGKSYKYIIKTYRRYKKGGKIRYKYSTYYTGPKTFKTKAKPASTTITIYDFLGVKETFVKQSDGTWKDTVVGGDYPGTWYIDTEEKDERVNNPRYNRDKDGEFDYLGETLLQKGGVTYRKTGIITGENSFVEGYNLDPEKVTFTIDHEIETVNTYEYNQGYIPVTKKYLMANNGLRLASFGEATVKDGNLVKKTIGFSSQLTGFVKEPVTVTAYYDGAQIGQATCIINPEAGEHGLSPQRETALSIIEQAIDPEGSYDDNMKAIERYVYDNYIYGEPVGEGDGTLYMSCDYGYLILETYSVWYNSVINGQEPVYGFPGKGGAEYESGHVAFHLESDPETWYETNGHRESSEPDSNSTMNGVLKRSTPKVEETAEEPKASETPSDTVGAAEEPEAAERASDTEAIIADPEISETANPIVEDEVTGETGPEAPSDTGGDPEE